MPITTSSLFPMSPDILALQPAIQQNRDIKGGKETMYLNRALYFPPLQKQTPEQYSAMVKMAPVYTLYTKVVQGFVGTIFRKPVILTGADNFDPLNVDLLGNNLQEYCQEVTYHVFENGFCTSLVDWSTELNRSFFKLVTPEQHVSYRVDVSKGYPELTRFIYREIVEKVNPTNEFDTEYVENHIVWDIELETGYVRVRKYETLTDGEPESPIGNPTYPMKDNQKLTKLPVILHGVAPNNFKVQKSPLQDISDLNIAVDQRLIDLIYMLHYTALPTAWATGVDSEDPDAPETIGPSQIWLIGNEAAKVGMLEFSGQSFDAHMSYMESLFYVMSAIGAQILKKEGVSRETASSVLIRTSSQTSLIATIVHNLSSQLEDLVKIKMDWDKQTYADDMAFTLNTDFVNADLSANDQIALVKSWLDGAISFPTMFEKMKEGEITPATRTVDEEQALIKKYPPPFFKENMAMEHDVALADKAAEATATAANEGGADNQPASDDTSGSNLDNPNVDNDLARENV